jgi:hypothetical protein
LLDLLDALDDGHVAELATGIRSEEGKIRRNIQGVCDIEELVILIY